MPGPEPFRLGVQLWTVREQLAHDYLGTLGEIAAAGYDGVELVTYREPGVAAVRAELDALGLRALGAHIPTQQLAAEVDAVVDELVRLGAEHLVVQQAEPADWATRDSVLRLSAELDAWGAKARDAGMRLSYHGYHPIEAEFATLGDTTPYDLMVASTDPGLVGIQVDTYWVRDVGRDPAATVRAYGARVPTVHLKDAAAAGGDVPVGDGVIDWHGVLEAAAEVGAGWLVVEQEDDPDNALRDIARSRAFLDGLRSGAPSAG